MISAAIMLVSIAIFSSAIKIYRLGYLIMAIERNSVKR